MAYDTGSVLTQFPVAQANSKSPLEIDIDGSSVKVSESAGSAVKLFYSKDQVAALTAIQRERYRPLFLPELLEEFIRLGIADKQRGSQGELPYLLNEFKVQIVDTASGLYIGRTSKGDEVAVIAHAPHYLLNPDNIRAARNQGLINGALPVPQEELDRLVESKDGNFTVLPFEEFTRQLFVSNPGTLITRGYGLETNLEPLFNILTKYLSVPTTMPGDKTISVGNHDKVGDVPIGRLWCVYRGMLRIGIDSVDSMDEGLNLAALPQLETQSKSQDAAAPAQPSRGLRRLLSLITGR